MFFKKKTSDDKNPIKVGQQLHLEVNDDFHGLDKVYKSRIADIQGSSLAIEIPIDEESGRIQGLASRTECTVTFIDMNGVKYTFNTTVTGKSMDNIPLLLLQMPEPDKIRKIQRRDYLRVPANLKLTFTSQNNEKSVEGTTIDVGGGGAGFALDSNIELELEEELLCSITIPIARKDPEEIPFSAKVVRIIPPNEGQSEQRIGLQIMEIKERDREKIIRYCFQREMELRK